jgi:hypothetical protein
MDADATDIDTENRGEKVPGSPTKRRHMGPACWKKDRVALALAGGQNMREAAGSCGVSEATVKRWRWQPSFVAKVDAFRQEINQQTLAHLIRASVKAVCRLESLIDSKNEQIAIQASRSVLEYNLKFRETDELAAAVQNLQAQMAAMEPVNGAAGRGDLPGKELPRVGAAGEEVAGGAEPGPVAAGFAAREGADEAPRPLFSP